MALQLKRGTNAARQLIIQEEGELFYTTDTQQIYAGDGSTPGGNPISNSESNATALAALTDTDLASVYDSQILAFNSFNNKWEATSTFTGNTQGVHSGLVDGDLTGSVFSDDSSIVIDGATGNVHTSRLVIRGDVLELNSESQNDNIKINVSSAGDYTALLNFSRISDSDLSGDLIAHGRITFSRNDSNGIVTTGFINARNDTMYIFQDIAGNNNDASRYVSFSEGALGVGTVTPTATLDVEGAIKPGVYADDTARDTAITTPVAGMIVFNTTNTKFQGYTGSSWVDFN